MLAVDTTDKESDDTIDRAGAWRIFASLLFGTFVAIEAAAFQAPALAPISRHFAVPVSSIALILLLYYLGAAVFAPMMGRLGDQIGRKRMILIGLGVFAAAEFMAALSMNFAFFLLARFIQGLGVACILPVVLAMIDQLFPAEKRGFPLGVLTFAMSAGATSGALIGGVLIDKFGWPSIYWVSGALALVVLLLVALTVPAMAPIAKRGNFDLKGALLLVATLGGLLAVPTLAGNFGMGSPLSLGVLAGSLICGLLLFRNCARTSSPVVEISLLYQRGFLFPAMIYLLHLLCYGGAVFCLAFFIADRPGGNASQVGFINMFVYGSSAIAAPIAGALVDRIGARRMLLVALTIMLICMLVYTQIRAETPLWMIAAFACVLGFVTGSKTPAVMQIALSTIPKQKMGSGSGLLTMLRDIGSPAGSSFSLAIYGSTVGAQLQQSVVARGEASGLGSEWHDELSRAAATRGQHLDAALAEELGRHGMRFSDLLEPSMTEAIAQAAPRVGFSLAVVMSVALLLAWLVPKAGKRAMG